MRVAVHRFVMPKAGVPAAPAPETMAPGDGMVRAHAAACIASLVHGSHHLHAPAGVLAVVVERVADRPRHAAWAAIALGLHLRVLQAGRVRLEPRPHQLAIPRPAVFGIGGRMHADEAAAVADEAFQRGLLVGVEHVAGGAGEYHHAVAGEVGSDEVGGVLAMIGRYGFARREVLQRGQGRGNGIVAELRGAREYEDAVRCGGDGAIRAGQEREHQQEQVERGAHAAMAQALHIQRWRHGMRGGRCNEARRAATHGLAIGRLQQKTPRMRGSSLAPGSTIKARGLEAILS